MASKAFLENETEDFTSTTEREKGNEKPKKKLLSGLKNILHPSRYAFKEKKNKHTDAVENDTATLPLAQFKILGLDTLDRPENQKTAPSVASDSDGNVSPCSSRSRRSDLFEQKIAVPELFDNLLHSRKNSDQSVRSCRIRDAFGWTYRTLDYQNKYHLFVQERINATNSENDEITRWDGNFPKNSTTHQLLKKLARDTGLTKTDIFLVKWIGLTEIQSEFPCTFIAGTLSVLFEKIIGLQSENFLSSDFIERFRSSAEKLVVTFVEHLTNAIGCLAILKELPTVHPTVSCFVKFFGMLHKFLRKGRRSVRDSEQQLMYKMDDLVTELSNEFSKASGHWFEGLISSMMHDCTVVTLANSASSLRDELNRQKKSMTLLFSSININLFDIVYSVWTTKFGELVSREIENACTVPIGFARYDISKTTVLDFEGSTNLYNLLEVSKDLFKVADKPKVFHELFRPCIPKWIDVNCVRALSQLEEAVKRDTFVADFSSRTSTSALDAESILQTIERLWKELDWPDSEVQFTMVVLTIKNLDRWILYYADLVYKRLNELDKSRFEDFEISDQLCVALNNVEKLRLRAETIVSNLKIPIILENLTHQSVNGTSLQQCKNTPPALMENLTDKVNIKMLEYFSSACHNIEPMITTLLEIVVSSETHDLDSLRIKPISHLDGILHKLNSRLSPEGFQKTFPILWNNVFHSFKRIVDTTSSETKMSALAFQHLKSLLISLESLFFPEPNNYTHLIPEEIELILELKAKLDLYATPSPQLALEYYYDRFNVQTILSSAQLANQNWLTIVPDRSDTTGQLRLQILNAFFPQSACDCYIKFQIVSPDFSETTKKHTSGVVKRNKYLLFEEMFIINLTEEEWSSRGMIHIWFKGRNGILWTQFLGEAFLPLKDIPITREGNPIRNSPQVRLPLTKPRETNSQFLQLLQNRTEDRFATNFVYVEEQRRRSLLAETTVTTP